MPWTDSGTPFTLDIFSILEFELFSRFHRLGRNQRARDLDPLLPFHRDYLVRNLDALLADFNRILGSRRKHLAFLDCGHSVFGTVYAHDLDLAELTRAVNGRRATDCRRIVECDTPVRSGYACSIFSITGIAVSTPGWISCSSTISMSGYLESASLQAVRPVRANLGHVVSQHHDLSLALQALSKSASPISWPAMKLSVATVLATRLVSSTGEL